MEEQADIVSTATLNVENNITPIIIQIQSNASNALNTANTANNTANTAKSIAEGANQALSYTNYETMITAFNELADNVYKVGQNIMIITLNVPDLWISAIENTSITYNYTNDEAITTALSTNGYIQVGYYKLSALETQKVDLTDYYTKTGTENKIEDYLYQIMPTDSASGTIATINDATTMFNAIDVTGTIEPVQDLHGYDSPWPAGGGKNILNPTIGWKKSAGSDVNLDASADGTITLSGTANVLNVFDATISFPVGTYTFSGFNDTAESKVQIYLLDSQSAVPGICLMNASNKTATFTSENELTKLRIRALAGFTGTFTFKPMLSTGSTAPTSWTPYSNICPITGCTGVQMVRTGVNIWGGEKLADDIVAKVPSATKNITNKTVTYSAAQVGSKVLFNNFKENTQYTFYMSTNSPISNLRIRYSDGTQKTIQPNTILVSQSGKTVDQLTGLYDSGNTTLRYEECGIFEGIITAQDFEPYVGNTYSASWQSEAGTVYGGSLDVTTGVLTVDRAIVDLGTLTYAINTHPTLGQYFYATITALRVKYEGPFGSTLYNTLCSAYKVVPRSPQYLVNGTFCFDGNQTNKQVTQIQIKNTAYTDATAFKATMTGQTLVYKLDTPQTYQLTPQQIAFLLGTNNLWVDTGDISVTYKADIQKYIDKKTN